MKWANQLLQQTFQLLVFVKMEQINSKVKVMVKIPNITCSTTMCCEATM